MKNMKYYDTTYQLLFISVSDRGQKMVMLIVGKVVTYYDGRRLPGDRRSMGTNTAGTTWPIFSDIASPLHELWGRPKSV